jgi:long-chain acyl-CoA synthetase
LVAVIVPDPHNFVLWAGEVGLKGKTVAEVMKDPEAAATVQMELEVFGKESGLQGFECVKRVWLEATMFSHENGLLTPTFKLKREIAKQRYKEQIDAMYASLDE